MIGDPATRYREDPVRMLRTVRFASKLGFTVDPATLAPIRGLADLLENVPSARLFDEMLKLLESGHAMACLRRLRDESGRNEDADPAPDAVVESRDAAVRLVLGLTDDERTLLELRMRGLGWKQVGEVLGIAEEAARQRWAALRRKARTAALQEAH